jgi:phenylpyruvate tautomerase PptA (4-oxalocrotonate tautomerase family)
VPLITVKVFEGELTWGQAAEMIEDITAAVIPFVGEAVRANTWVLVEEVKAWGIGGKALGLGDLRQIQQNAPPDQQPYSRRERKQAADESDRQRGEGTPE